MQNHEQVILVDSNDKEIGREDKLIAHQKGLLHRAFSVFIFNTIQNERYLLLQQRQHDKYHSANLWTNTCCSHPRPGETIIEAGERRLQEEMGLCISLQEAGNFVYTANFDNGLVEHEFDHVLVGHYHNETVKINKNEVANYKWETVTRIREEYKCFPEKFTPWFYQALEIAL